MLFFTQSKKDEQPITKLTHGREIAQYCKTRIAELEAVIPVLELYAVRGYYAYNPNRRAARQIELFKAILAQIESKESEQFVAQNVKRLAEGPILVPYGRDILSIMRTGKPVLPSELSEIAQFLEKEKKEAEAERIRLGIQRKAREKQELEKKVQAEKQAKLAQLAEQTGIPLDKLQQLKGS
jgi:hypothetical protein